MTCSRRALLRGCVAGVLITALPRAHATPAVVPERAVTVVRMQHAPAAHVHLPSPRTFADAHSEHRRARMQGVPLRRHIA